jgi:hypothetical protein
MIMITCRILFDADSVRTLCRFERTFSVGPKPQGGRRQSRGIDVRYRSSCVSAGMLALR